MMLKNITRYLLIFLISVIISLSFTSNLSAQLPFLPNINEVENHLPETPAWDLNKAKPCGKYWCSNIYFYSNRIFNDNIITIALPREKTKTSKEVSIDVEQRAKFIQTVFQQIFYNIQLSGKLNISQQTIKDDRLKFWLYTNKKPIHPFTPTVEIGKENNQTVIYLPANLELGLAQQTIITVTKVDAQVNGTTLMNLAQEWREEVRYSLSEAIWGLEMDQQKPFLRLQVTLFTIAGTFGLILITKIIRDMAKKWKKNLVKELSDLYNSLTVNPVTQKSEKVVYPQDIENEVNKNIVIQDTQYQKNNQTIQRLLSKGINSSTTVISNALFLSNKLLPTKLRQRQNLVRQQINISELIISVIGFSQLTIIFCAIASIVFTYRETRSLFNLFFTQALTIPLIWIVMLLTDKVIDFWIDYSLNQWAKERHLINPNSNRPSLRVNTYSHALRGATTIVFTGMGIFLTLGVIGWSPTVIAGASALAVVFAFLSRNILEDILNGILILAGDRYAVGDVVEINGLSGCVETMSLYTTSLRNLDGQLTIIPNSKISTVVNMTKNWSRVNFTIELAWNTDLHKTMSILQNTADLSALEEKSQELIQL